MMEQEIDQKAFEQLNPIASARIKMAKALLFLSALVFFTFGASLLAIGMYIQLDHGFVSEIIGSALYQAAAYVAIVSGFLVFFLGILGANAACSQKRWQLVLYVTCLIVLSLMVLVSGLLAILFRATLIETTKGAMRNSLKQYYGKTKLVTEAWDLTQARLRCCAVDRSGWSLYLNSEWNLMVNSDARNLQERLPAWSPLYRYVPKSCCLKLIDPRTLWPSGGYKDLAQCQYWPYGPPNHAIGGFNDALYYRGCYEAGAEFVSSHGRFVAAIGFLLFIAMIIGTVCALAVLANANLEVARFRRNVRTAYMKSGLLLPGEFSGGGGGKQFDDYPQ